MKKNISLTFHFDASGHVHRVDDNLNPGNNDGLVFSYDHNYPRNGKNFSFIPTQNWISFEYNLCEVMQWLPQPMHQRRHVAAEFWLDTSTEIIQSQLYKNYKFDSKGNQISLTYGDNVLQKTTWYCR